MRIKALSALILICCVSPFASGETTFRVMSYNIFQLAVTNWDQQQRAYRLESAIRKLEPIPDVIVFNEVFSEVADQTLEHLRDLYPYQTPNVGQSCHKGWDQITGNCSSLPLVSRGGVVILSQHPIEYRHAHIYKNTLVNSWDFFANKGFAYIQVQKEGERFHVFGTHLQATHDDIADSEHRIRMQQLAEMQAIISDYNISQDEAVIIAGDMNVEWKQHAQVQEMLQQLNAKVNVSNEQAYTYSAKENWLTKLFYLRFGGDATFEDTLDYVLLSQSHRLAKQYPPQQTLTLKAESPWYWPLIQGQWPLPEGQFDHNGFYSELSDHFPVVVDFIF
jgi:phospholipase C